jgi:Protein of unknown function (DUF2782)
MQAMVLMKSLRGARLLLMLTSVACTAFAQTPPAPPPMPTNIAPPPLPAANDAAPPATASPTPAAPPRIQEEYRGGTDEEPQVTTIQKDAETLEEVRVGGTLRYVRVTPRRGKPYYLVPSGNGQTFNRMDSLGSGLSVPMWMLFSW